MDEDKLIEAMIVDDFTPITRELERIQEQEENETERGSTNGL